MTGLYPLIQASWNEFGNIPSSSTLEYAHFSLFFRIVWSRINVIPILNVWLELGSEVLFFTGGDFYYNFSLGFVINLFRFGFPVVQSWYPLCVEHFIHFFRFPNNLWFAHSSTNDPNFVVSVVMSPLFLIYLFGSSLLSG